MSFKLDYNAPVILTFSLICAVLYGAHFFTGGSINPYLGFGADLNGRYLSVFTYIFAHADLNHLVGNMTFILLLGPTVEAKYGSINLMIIMALTALISSSLSMLFLDVGGIGASGIVFLFIILVSFAGGKEGTIPVSFLLILALFLGKEVLNSFNDDNISQFGHIAGGICGSIVGFFGPMSRSEPKE